MLHWSVPIGFSRSNRVISELRPLYRDADDLLRTVINGIYKAWDSQLGQLHLKKIEYAFEDPQLPVPSDTVEVAVETRHGWLI